MTRDEVPLTVEEPPEVRERLEMLAQISSRSPTVLIREALEAYLELHEWQTEAVHEALAEVESGAPLVEHAAVLMWQRSWGTDHELPRPE